jgi:FAD/FMN-containing dehydrogenase
MKTLRVENLPLRLAIRGGGHSTLVGSSNIKGGITLDMRGMNNISLQENGQIVSVGAGAVWGDVYSELSPLNLSVVGGHGYDVGVAGFTLGGKLN